MMESVTSTILFIVVTYIIYYTFIKKNLKWSSHDPPGVGFELPLVGSLHRLGKTPHLAFQKLNKGRSIMSLWLGDYYTVVVTDPVLIREIWVNHFDSFSGRSKTATGKIYSGNYINLLSSDYDKWRPLRTIVSTTFTKTKLKHSLQYIEEQTKQLMEYMSHHEEDNKIFYQQRYLKRFTLNVVLMICFSEQLPFNLEGGETKDELSEIIDAINSITKITGQGNMFNFIKIFTPLIHLSKQKKITDNINTIKRFVRKVYNHHIIDLDESNPRDLLDVIIMDSKQDSNPIERTLRVAIDLVVAGTDTSASTVEFLMLFMINYPNIQEKVCSELSQVYKQQQLDQQDKKEGESKKYKLLNLSSRSQTTYTNAVIKEMLRLKPIAPTGLNRRCNTDIMIGDYYIPKNAQVLMNIYGVHHSEKYWDRPEEFIPERFLSFDSDQDSIAKSCWIPFSIGSRNCVGGTLAMDEIWMAFSNIMLNFNLKSQDGNQLDEQEIFGITIRAKPFGVKLEKSI